MADALTPSEREELEDLLEALLLPGFSPRERKIVSAAVQATLAHVRDAARDVSTERDRLRAAVLWALGLNGDFAPEPPPLAGKYRRRYYWRTELAERAGIDVNAVVLSSAEDTPVPCPYCDGKGRPDAGCPSCGRVAA